MITKKTMTTLFINIFPFLYIDLEIDSGQQPEMAFIVPTVGIIAIGTTSGVVLDLLGVHELRP
jgi:hypothetical protein